MKRSIATCESVNVFVEALLEDFGFPIESGFFVGVIAALVIGLLFLAFAGGDRIRVVRNANEDLRRSGDAVEGYVVLLLLRVDVLETLKRQIEREIENALDAFVPSPLALFRLLFRHRLLRRLKFKTGVKARAA